MTWAVIGILTIWCTGLNVTLILQARDARRWRHRVRGRIAVMESRGEEGLRRLGGTLEAIRTLIRGVEPQPVEKQLRRQWLEETRHAGTRTRERTDDGRVADGGGVVPLHPDRVRDRHPRGDEPA